MKRQRLPDPKDAAHVRMVQVQVLANDRSTLKKKILSITNEAMAVGSARAEKPTTVAMVP